MRCADSYDRANRSHAMPIDPPEVIETDSPKVHCDGGGGALGHPRVWLQIPEDTGWVECPYCDCKYVLKGTEQG